MHSNLEYFVIVYIFNTEFLDLRIPFKRFYLCSDLQSIFLM